MSQHPRGPGAAGAALCPLPQSFAGASALGNVGFRDKAIVPAVLSCCLRCFRAYGVCIHLKSRN